MVASEETEERTELPALSDKDRLCFVKKAEENSPKKADEGSGQNAIIYQTIKCKGEGGFKPREMLSMHKNIQK